MFNKLRIRILEVLCLTSVAFIFQACYGTPQGLGRDSFLIGQVKSKNTGKPLSKIKVSLKDGAQYVETKTDGSFSLYVDKLQELSIRFEDNDGTQNGLYLPKDTVIKNENYSNFIDIKVVELEESK